MGVSEGVSGMIGKKECRRCGKVLVSYYGSKVNRNFDVEELWKQFKNS